MTNSTVSGNSAFCDGGANFNCNSLGGGIINVSGGTVNVTNSTFSDNSASCNAGLGRICNAQGGGLYNNNTLNVTNSTISDSSVSCTGLGCATQGGGILTQGTVTFESTILANSTGADCVRAIGTVNAQYSLIEDGLTSVNGTNTNNLTGDPMLGPLAYYGGPTATHILKTGSQAIDTGKNFGAATNDQRGFVRTVDDGSIANASGGDGTDIGAFEHQPSDIDPTLVVTKTADTNDGVCDADCSLREAITAANASVPDDVIYFAVTGAITLNSLGALPALDSNIQILGPGANALTVKRDSSAAAFRIFSINIGETVTISGLSVSNGSASDGGGIKNDHATLTVNDCTISGNSATNDTGGGILNDGSQFGSATLTINNSTLSDNSAPSEGGCILNAGEGGSATLTINNSTLSGNSAFDGGVIFNNALGGGSATVTVNNSTFSGNTASDAGSAFFNLGGFGGIATVTIGDTVLDVGASGAANFEDFGGAFTSLGYNLSSDAAGGDATTGPGGFLNNTGDIRNTDPMLGPLQDNGGPTFTHALLPGSPVIDQGKNFSGAANDQRGPGFARTSEFPVADAAGGDGTDIGAFEVQAPPNSPPTAMDDGYTTDEDTPLNVAAPGVLGNDSDPDTGDSITAALVSGPSHAASFALNSDGSFSYTPAANYNGSDSFTYKARDSHNADSNTVTVNITINAVNDPPTITAASGVTRQQAAGASNSSIATVNDIEDNKNTLSVTVNGSSSATVNGVTVSNIAVDSLGNVTANVAAACGATNAGFTLRVTDSGASFAEATLNVTVTAETTPPIINSISASPNLLKPPNHTLRLVTVNVSASDNCTPNPVCNIISVTSNEPDNGCGSGDQPNDIQNINGLTVQLRSERCGTSKTGRIYTITVQCKDASGNTSTKTTTVTVKK